MSLRTSRILASSIASLTLALSARAVPTMAANNPLFKTTPTPQAAVNAMLIEVGGVNKVIDIAGFAVNDASGPVVGSATSGDGAGKAAAKAATFTMAAVDASPAFLGEEKAKKPLAKIVVHYDGKTYTLLGDKIASVKTGGDRDTVTVEFETIQIVNGTAGQTATDKWDVAPK